MAIQQDKDVYERNSCKIGDLVRYVTVVQGVVPQVWEKKTGVGIILHINSNSCTYTVLSKGKTIDCIEVYPVCSKHEFESIRK